MQKTIADNDLEKFLMSLGAAFVEENHILDELLQRIDVDSLHDPEHNLDEVQLALKEVGTFFFSLNMGFEEELQSEILEILDLHWNVRDSQSADATLKEIREQGHRTKFNVLRSVLPATGKIESGSLEKFKQIFIFDFENPQDIKMSEEDLYKLAQWIQSTHKYLGPEGILGWDMARYVHVVRLYFMAGYFSADQAWKAINELSPIIVGKFPSWMEFSQSFLIGRTFWGGVDTPEIKQSCERLMGYPISPWVLLKWPRAKV